MIQNNLESHGLVNKDEIDFFTVNELSNHTSRHSYGADTTAEHIPLAPEVIGHIGHIPITNSLFNSFLLSLLLCLTAIILSKKITAIPGKFQAFVEIIIEYIYNMSEELARAKVTIFFPWIMTFFIYILIANLFSLMPGMSTIGFFEAHAGSQKFIPIFRPINSDLNMTLALGILSVLVTHYYAIRITGIRAYLQRWFSVKMFGAALFVGILELVAEFTKIISLSFRLFGNILSGKVLIKTASSLSAFIVPIPFYFLELVIAIVQAATFFILTLVFMVVLTDKHDS